MNSEQITKAKADLRAEALQRAYADGKKGHLNLSELWPYYTEEMRLRDEELRCREMVISCVCYGMEYDFYDEEKEMWGQYGLDYMEKLGQTRALEIFRDQRDYMRKHATIHVGVHSDFEGCSYNSIDWD